MNQSVESQNWDSSDPDMTSFILSLVGDLGGKLSNPFQLSDNIKKELILMAERTGARALAWDLSLFNKVGGNGTLTSVWNRLKSSNLVGGTKRPLSSESEGEEEHKKLRISLNLSGTCDLINNIELQGADGDSMAVSDSERSRDAVFFGEQDELGNMLAREYVSYNSSDLESQLLSDSEAIQIPQRDLELLPSVSESEALLVSENESMPPLASPDPLTSGYSGLSGGESDSGVTEDGIGAVTNLCRPRRQHQIRNGMITETGPYMPVSLGFSLAEPCSSDWEEVVDSDGFATGVERRCFRLNIEDGHTESIDEDLNNILLLNGLSDGTNSRRLASGVDGRWNGHYLDDVLEQQATYEADISGSDEECERDCHCMWCFRATQADGLRDVDGCPRATLREPVRAGGDAQFDAGGCSRATLSDIRGAGGEVSIDVGGCSHATLSDIEGAAGEVSVDVGGCSIATLRNIEGEGGEDHTDVAECSRTTLIRCQGGGGLYCTDNTECPRVLDVDGNGVLGVSVWVSLLIAHLRNMLMVWWTLNTIVTTGNWVVYGATSGGGTRVAQSTQTDSSLLESNCVGRGNEAARNGYIEQSASRRGDSDFGRPVCHDGLENVIQGDGSSSE